MCGGALTADITQKLNQNKIKKIKGAGGKGHAWDKNKACSARGHAKFHQIILKYENIKDTTGNIKRYKWLLQRDAEGFFIAEICDSAQSSASAIELLPADWFSPFECCVVGEIHELFVVPEMCGRSVGIIRRGDRR